MAGKVSVALATYNGAKYLREQLDSIYDQTYGEVEVVVSDDHSTDDTMEILQEYARSHNLRWSANDENVGFLKNFDRVIRMCDGEFIALADQDDIWLPQKLEVLVGALQDHTLIYSDAELIDENGRPLGSTLSRNNRLHFIRGSRNRAFVFNNCASGNTMLFRQALTQHILPIPDAMAFHDIWITFVASTVGTIDYVRTPLVYYRRHAESVTTRRHIKRSRIASKARKRLEKRAKLTKKVRCFSELAALPDGDRTFFRELSESAERYKETFFDVGFLRFLLGHRHALFEIKTAKSWKRIVRLSVGYKTHRCRLRLEGRLRGLFGKRQ